MHQGTSVQTKLTQDLQRYMYTRDIVISYSKL